MKKKHELIKYAYDNFPKGTKFTWGGDTIISTGKFHLYKHSVEVSESDIEYTVFDGNKWAEIIPESILSGKCAISVSNEREFKLLMDHMDSKGWLWASKDKPHRITYKSCENSHSKNLTYEDGFSWWSDDYKIIPFKDFAAESGIEVPKVLYYTMDNVPVYNKDKVYIVSSNLGHPIEFSKAKIEEKIVEIGTGQCHETSYQDKSGTYYWAKFSSKEAAETWIKEQNKQKEVVLKLDGATVTVTNDKINIKMTTSGLNYWFEPNDLEAMYKAYKSLQ